jgi:hypothetical protein
MERLEKFFKNSESKMTRDRYFKMCEQMGKEPQESEIPPDEEDFPDIALIALNTFSALGDRIYPEIGYMGKDFTNLPLYMELHGIEDSELFLEILTYLESRAIKDSQTQLKRERDRLKRKP